MRELLAALPDPGPMPAELIRRIELRLEVEQAHRARDGAFGTADVLDLAAEQSRRRPGRTLSLLGAAAAGLVITTVALSQLPLGPGGAGAGGAAQYPSPEAVQDAAARDRSAADEGGADDGGAADGGAEAGADAGADAGAAAADLGTAAEEDSAAQTGSGELLVADEGLVLLAPLGTVDVRTFGTQVHEAATAADPRLDDAAMTLVQAQRCWEASGAQDSWAHRSVAPAQLEEDPVVAVLAVGDDATGTAYLLPWSCTTGVGTTPIAVVPVLP
jgi:hypothetical protein